MSREKEPCQYCGTPTGNRAMHEKYCIKNPNGLSLRKVVPTKDKDKIQEIMEKSRMKSYEIIEESQSSRAEPVLSTTDHNLPPGSPDTQPPKRSLHWGYKIITALVIVSGVIQYFIFDIFRINKWLLLILYVLDLIFYVFLMWKIWSFRKKQEIVVFETIDDFIEQVPKWSIDGKPPNKGIIGSILNMGKEYKPIVLVSKNFEPKMIWSEWNGFQFSINNRAYIPPNGSIRGDVFFYNMDKKCPLIDTAEVTPEDAEDSFQLDAVWNQAFAVGHAAAMSKSQGQIQLILILVAACLGLILILGIFTYGQFGQVHDEIRAVHAIAANTSQMIQQNQLIVHN